MFSLEINYVSTFTNSYHDFQFFKKYISKCSNIYKVILGDILNIRCINNIDIICAKGY